MTPEEEAQKEKGIIVVSGGIKNRAALLSILLQEGFSPVSDEVVICGDPIGFPDEDCTERDDYRDFNNGRVISHTPPFYTQSKRDVYRNPKGSKRRSR